MSKLRLIFALSGCLLCSGVAGAAPVDRAWNVEAEVAFLQASEFSALTPDKQDARVAKFYGSLLRFKSAIDISITWRPLNDGESTPAEKRLPPREQLHLASARGDHSYAAMRGYALVLETLRAHPDEIAALIRVDLRSDDEARQQRGLEVLFMISPPLLEIVRDGASASVLNAATRAALYDDVAEIFQSLEVERANPQLFGLTLLNRVQTLKTRAQWALISLDDPRAIALLVADDPSRPTRHAWPISVLAKRVPDDAALLSIVPYLSSTQAYEREDAVVALPVTLPAVRAALPRLLDDEDRGVTKAAIRAAFQLEGAQFAALEAQLIAKLTDADKRVRLDAAVGFAKRNDPIAAPILVSALREDTSQVDTQSYSDYLNQSIGFDSGYNSARPSDDSARKRHNAAVLKRVEAWIAAHPTR